MVFLIPEAEKTKSNSKIQSQATVHLPIVLDVGLFNPITVVVLQLGAILGVAPDRLPDSIKTRLEIEQIRKCVARIDESAIDVVERQHTLHIPSGCTHGWIGFAPLSENCLNPSLHRMASN